MLLVFKAARRQEYLQENLRVLGALRGETVETAYGPRWQSEGVRRRPPEPGEEALVVFTSRPYQRFTPARFGRVVEGSTGEEGQLRLVLELGSRAHVADHDRWQRWVSAGPNPSEASQVWVCRDGDERDPAADPAPVEYADAAHDERAWRRTIDRLVHDDDYARAVFLRVGSVRPASPPSMGRRPGCGRPASRSAIARRPPCSRSPWSPRWPAGPSTPAPPHP